MFGVMALFAVGMIFSPLAASTAAAAIPYPDDNGPQPNDNGDFLDLKKVIVKDDGDAITDIIYKTGGFIPQDDEAVEPFGYGVVTEVPSQTGTGTELNVIATTSHAGILDSEAQEGDEDNPILHNHYAVLGNNPACGTNPSIAALSEEEPGQVFVKGKTVLVKDLPPFASAEVESPGMMTEIIEITPGNDIQFVASFTLQVVPPASPGSDPVVCVIPEETLDERTIIFEDKAFKPDYPRPGYDNHDEGYGNGYEYANEMSYDKQNGYEYANDANEMSYDKQNEYEERY
jgi:hypothetical protein